MEFAYEKAGRAIDFFFCSKLVRGGLLLDYEVFEFPSYFNSNPQDLLKQDVERVAKDFRGAIEKYNEQPAAPE